jgi:predicted acyl esterase
LIQLSALEDLLTDQRAVVDWPDVLAYQTQVLTAPVRLSGTPIADLYAATTGADADWVVKLIDVFPDEVSNQPEVGGYQLPIAMDTARCNSPWSQLRAGSRHPTMDQPPMAGAPLQTASSKAVI